MKRKMMMFVASMGVAAVLWTVLGKRLVRGVNWAMWDGAMDEWLSASASDELEEFLCDACFGIARPDRKCEVCEGSGRVLAPVIRAW